MLLVVVLDICIVTVQAEREGGGAIFVAAITVYDEINTPGLARREY